MTTFIAHVRRELWEHPALYVAPIVIGALLLGLSVIILVGSIGSEGSPQLMIHGLDLAGASRVDAGVTVALLSFLPVFVLPLIVIVNLYLLDSLSTERRDRSILFFKSLPVSDLTTVLSKLATAALVAPALMLAALVMTQLGVLIFGSITLSLGNGGAAVLWDPSRLLSIWVLAAYNAVAFGLWFAPFYCFFLAVSAWARRATLVWAASPLLLILVERAFTGRTLLGQLLGEYTGSFLPTAFAHRFRVMIVSDEGVTESLEEADLEALGNIWAWMDPAGLLLSPMLWAGLIIAAGFTTVAVLLRRYRDDS